MSESTDPGDSDAWGTTDDPDTSQLGPLGGEGGSFSGAAPGSNPSDDFPGGDMSGGPLGDDSGGMSGDGFSAEGVSGAPRSDTSDVNPGDFEGIDGDTLSVDEEKAVEWLVDTAALVHDAVEGLEGETPFPLVIPTEILEENRRNPHDGT